MKNKEGKEISKPSSQWSELKKRNFFLNSKFMNAPFYVLDKKEFHRFLGCTNAYEIWRKACSYL